MNAEEALIKANSGMTQVPECAVEGCENKAFILLQGRFVCGECCKRFQEYKQKMTNEILNNMNNDTGDLSARKTGS